jgi:polyhydroxyalkanoate synthesis regulator phasin
MNLDTASEALQKGFRVTLGATTALVEGLQNPQQYNDTFARIQRGDIDQLTEEWAEKGGKTEEEARRFVESMMNSASSSTPNASTSGPSVTGPAIPTDIQIDLDDLTQQIISIRQDLENENGGAS